MTFGKSKTTNFEIRIALKTLRTIPVFSAIGKKSDNKYPLDILDSDLPSVMMHELFHIFHQIEDIERYIDDSNDKTKGYWPMFWNEKVFGQLWTDAEEQRTVIGRYKKNDISENSIRQNAGMQLRYPYVPSQIKFEEATIIETIFNNQVKKKRRVKRLKRVRRIKRKTN